MITGDQLRMARTALRLGIRDLAKEANVAPATITRIEAGKSAHASTLAAIRRALEEAGIEFPDDRTVRLKEPREGRSPQNQEGRRLAPVDASDQANPTSLRSKGNFATCA